MQTTVVSRVSLFVFKTFAHTLLLIAGMFYSLGTETILMVKLKHLHVVSKPISAREDIPAKLSTTEATLGTLCGAC